ncbi:L domain-like protein [Xylariaceae sp. FL0016]|nr:L domain-like protein [Xylariaceae sp. FL0016]
MDEKRNRLSAIPRPSSRLPLPRSGIPTPAAPAAHPLSSDTPQTANTSVVRNPRLRTTPSRERINTTQSQPRPPRSIAPPVSSQSALRGLSSRSSSLTREVKLRSSLSNLQETDRDVSVKNPVVPRRRPSSQFSISARQTPVQQDTSPIDDDQDATALPALTKSPEEGLTFDELFSKPRKPRPSLSERTIETLSQLPSSPAVKRNGGNLYDADGFRRPQSKGSGGSRPGSSYQSDGSRPRSARSLSRPGSSSGPPENDFNSFRASTNTYKPPLSTVHGTPTRRISSVAALKTPTPATKITRGTTPRSTLSKTPSRVSLSATVGTRTPSPEKFSQISVSKNGSKTIAARPLKPRASVNGLFKKPSLSSLEQPLSQLDSPLRPARKASLVSVKSSSTSGEGRNPSSASTVSTVLTTDSEEAPVTNTRKSSSALREQIAKAKAAKRTASRQVSSTTMPNTDETPVVPTDDTFDFGLSDDPFGQHKFESSNRKVMQSRINMARTTGRLNIAAMGLKEIPDEVLKMYDLDSIGRSDGAWAESVDLTRFVAADNELESIEDSIFPDVDPNDFSSDDVDDRGQIFWGLESADLHNNMLISLPMGLRRLQQLTSLNLASNKLTNNCLEIISQCTNLRDLKLANNLLYGAMEECFVLENLEILDIRGNNISGLPSGIDRMHRLRILNLDENAFTSLPFRDLAKLPLTELTARKNKLEGTLITGVEGLPHLQMLDCSSNQLSYLVAPNVTWPLNLPALHQLTVSMNRLKELPDLSSWASILTINADDNSIVAFPEGFVSRETLRHAGLSSNDIRVVPAEIARMDSLAMLRITGNPLRDKKFTSYTTEELKDALAARLEPLPSHEAGGIEQFANGIDSFPATAITTNHAEMISSTGPDGGDDEDEHSDLDDFATPPTSAPHSPAPARSRSHTLSNQVWPIKPGGVLDRSNTESSSLHPVVCSKIAVTHSVREVRLQHNTFTQFPNSLSFFADTVTSLSLSHNQLTGESWLTEQLDLTALKELNLQSNFCTSLMPLTTYLCAPNLEKLDISFNRVVRLPVLRDFFPSLAVLLISNNRLEDLDPDSIKGMKIVDASNNEIVHLNPRLGLLGLERMEVMGNRFRVPRFNVLERGTESTLRWLRGRVPVAEMAEWKAKHKDEDDSFNDTD